MKSGLPKLCLLFALCLSLAASAGPSMKRRAWITIGDAAYRQVKTIAPDAVSIDSRQLPAEKVHAIVVDEGRLAKIAGAIHQRLGQCGGYMYHASEAEARAALDRRRVLAPARAYAIAQRELVEPMLAGMQEKQIEASILSLSGFTNRYFRSQSGVDASNWLLATWRELAAGRADISVMQVHHQGSPQPSVSLTIAGSDLAEETVVVGAHLDSIIGIGMSETARARRAPTTTRPAWRA